MIREMLSRLFFRDPERVPVTHALLHYDFLTPYDGGARISIGGWSYKRPWEWEPGDFVIIHTRDGTTTRYRVVERECYADPPDMWIATLDFAPREPTRTKEKG